MALNPRRASQIKSGQVTWLWEDRIPAGMFSLVAGRPGQGKSLFTAYLTAQVTRMGGVVLFSNDEDDEEAVTRPRLQAAGADLTKVLFAKPMLPNDLEELEKLIVDENIRLVILDPINAHFTVSLTSDQDARKAMSPLSKMLARTGCTVVGVDHMNKSASAKAHPLAAIRGSSGGVVGAARAAFLFGPSPDNYTDERILAPAKFNLGNSKCAMAFEIEPVEIETDDGSLVEIAKLTCLGEEPKITAADVVGFVPTEANVHGNPSKRAAAAEWLTRYLSVGAAPMTDIREDAIQSGFSMATIRRAKDDIGVQVSRRDPDDPTKGKFGPGSVIYWELPMGHPALIELPDAEDDPDGIQTVADEVDEVELDEDAVDEFFSEVESFLAEGEEDDEEAAIE
jgi:hypothetical protein